MIERLTPPWLTVRVEIALGALFVAAALPKILDPPAFAHMIYNYRMVPGGLVNVMALVLPWCELLAGLGLILGLLRGGASLLITASLVVFVAAIGFNLARGNAIICGCFDPTASGWSEERKLAAMRWDLWRDAGMLVRAAVCLAAVRRRDREGAAAH